MIDKTITHEQARKDVSYWIPQYQNNNISKIRLNEYITQQEKKDKLFEQLYNVCKEYQHTSIGLSDDSEFLNVMFELEEEMK